MYRGPPQLAWWRAVGAPLERGVRVTRELFRRYRIATTRRPLGSGHHQVAYDRCAFQLQRFRRGTFAAMSRYGESKNTFAHRSSELPTDVNHRSETFLSQRCHSPGKSYRNSYELTGRQPQRPRPVCGESGASRPGPVAYRWCSGLGVTRLACCTARECGQFELLSAPREGSRRAR